MFSSISEIWRLPLTIGDSRHPAEGACAMDAVSWLVYGHLGDHPACVCDVIGDYVINMNDTFGYTERQKLRGYLLRFIDTVDPDNEDARTEFLMQHTMNVLLPAALDYLYQNENVRQVRRIKTDLQRFARAWKLPIDLRHLTHELPHVAFTGIPEHVAYQFKHMLTFAYPVFNGPSPFTMLPFYLMKELQEYQNRTGATLTSEITTALWQGLDGVLAIGKQGSETYLDRPAIDGANETFQRAVDQKDDVLTSA